MRWRTGRRSQNIEDRRSLRPSRGAVGGGIGALIFLLVALFLGVDPSILLQDESMVETPAPEAPRDDPRAVADNDELADFVSVVLADTEDSWRALFRERGWVYEEPILVLFAGAAQSACGFAQAAVGPFYCPGDRRIYIDLSFYRDLRSRFRAPGDFAQAYVIAHEVGHHVQTLLGITREVEGIRGQLAPADANALSVRMELQADCFAGVWAHHAHRTRQILETGDIEEGLNAASAIGDDRMQMEATGYISPESFTHGSSEQRVRWFNHGLAEGDPASCDTFNAARL